MHLAAFFERLTICSWFNWRLILSSQQAKSNNQRRQFWQMVIETWQGSGNSRSCYERLHFESIRFLQFPKSVAGQ